MKDVQRCVICNRSLPDHNNGLCDEHQYPQVIAPRGVGRKLAKIKQLINQLEHEVTFFRSIPETLDKKYTSKLHFIVESIGYREPHKTWDGLLKPNKILDTLTPRLFLKEETKK